MTSREQRPCLVVVHPGGLGDLVLMSELIENLKQAYSQSALILICRAEFTEILSGYPVPPDEVIGLEFQPYAWAEPSEELSTSLDQILLQFTGRPVALLVDAALRPNWLPDFLTGALKPSAAIRCSLRAGSPQPPSAILEQLVRNLDLPANTHERDRYRILVEGLESSFARTLPWSLPEQWKEPAMDWLRGHSLERGRYLVCAPFGSASTVIKRWPLESFAEVLHRFFSKSGWPVVLMGDRTESESLAGLELLLFDMPTARFAGSPGELPLAAGILSMAGAYLSNDSGLMHLAQAYEVPGAAIFGGGGEWPAYAPWARGSTGLCNPLPCFGCGWDCFAGHGLCVESVPVEEVFQALCDACQTPMQAPRSFILDTIEEPLLGVIADASARYRESQRGRSDRLEVIVELDRARCEWADQERDLRARLEQAEARAAEMERVAAERLDALERVHSEAARRLDLMHEISDQAEARRISVEQLTSALAQSEAARLQLEEALADPDKASASSGA